VIVISGALVLVAFVLLVLGLGLRELDYVYGSIAVSLTAFVFLIIGVLQRRGDETDLDVLADDDQAVRGTGTGPAPAPAPVTAAEPRGTAQGAAGLAPAPPAEPEAGATTAAGGGSVPLVLPDSAPTWPAAPAGAADQTVVVIPQRSRFHVPQCRFVRDVVGTEQMTRAQAEDQGHQPCDVCRP
jgi:hypothetical protein